MTPAVAHDPVLQEQYEHLKTKGSNRAKVAMARRLLTIAFQVLRDSRPYQRHVVCPESGSKPSRLS